MSSVNDLYSTLNRMTKEDLVNLCAKFAIDSTFDMMNRDAAKLFRATIPAGKTMLFIDLANMHGINHKYGMSTVDQFINNVFSQFRHSDTWIRWGSDEIVVILNSGDAVEFIGRLDLAMTQNNLYAVYGIVTTSNSLVESIDRADSIVMAMKRQLEKFGLKADRNDEYVRLTSQVVTE